MSLPSHLFAGDLPASVSGAEINKNRAGDPPQRKDYVAPVAGAGWPVFDTEDDINLLFDIHRFIEINAVFTKEKEMARRLREILES